MGVEMSLFKKYHRNYKQVNKQQQQQQQEKQLWKYVTKYIECLSPPKKQRGRAFN